jgi:hypothetical protein
MNLGFSYRRRDGTLAVAPACHLLRTTLLRLLVAVTFIVGASCRQSTRQASVDHTKPSPPASTRNAPTQGRQPDALQSGVSDDVSAKQPTVDHTKPSPPASTTNAPTQGRQPDALQSGASDDVSAGEERQSLREEIHALSGRLNVVSLATFVAVIVLAGAWVLLFLDLREESKERERALSELWKGVRAAQQRSKKGSTDFTLDPSFDVEQLDQAASGTRYQSPHRAQPEPSSERRAMSGGRDADRDVYQPERVERPPAPDIYYEQPLRLPGSADALGTGLPGRDTAPVTLFVEMFDSDGLVAFEKASGEKGIWALYQIETSRSMYGEASVSTVDNPGAHRRALDMHKDYLYPVCNYSSPPGRNHTRIDTASPGVAVRERDYWRVTQRLKIRFK